MLLHQNLALEGRQVRELGPVLEVEQELVHPRLVELAVQANCQQFDLLTFALY